MGQAFSEARGPASPCRGTGIPRAGEGSVLAQTDALKGHGPRLVAEAAESCCATDSMYIATSPNTDFDRHVRGDRGTRRQGHDLRRETLAGGRRR
jgi:hypothetical protein